MSVTCINGVYMADTARVLGDVELGRDVNIWYGVSIRGDVARIVVGENTNIQDNAVVHCDYSFPNVIGPNVTIGHGAVVHGELVGEWTLIGISASVLGHTKIGKRCLIGAGAVVPPGMVVPDDSVVLGVPGKIVRPTNDEEKSYLMAIPPRYVAFAKMHAMGNDPRSRRWGA